MFAQLCFRLHSCKSNHKQDAGGAMQLLVLHQDSQAVGCCPLAGDIVCNIQENDRGLFNLEWSIRGIYLVKERLVTYGRSYLCRHITNWDF